MKKIILTPEQEQFIHDHYLTMTGVQIGQALGFSKQFINDYKRNHRLIVPKKTADSLRIKSMIGRTTFTPEMDDYLRQNYLSLPADIMAKAIGKSKFGTRYRMKILGLVVPQEIIEERRYRGLNNGNGWNKGRKQSEYMSAEMIARMAKTQFKKGHKPHNTRQDGDLCLRCDGYVWVRTALAVWELLHRVIYQQHHGVQLDTADNIIFLDGNRQNFEITNLKCVTNEELMSMNTIHRYPDDLKQAMKALAKLKRKIKAHEKQDNRP